MYLIVIYLNSSYKGDKLVIKGSDESVHIGHSYRTRKSLKYEYIAHDTSRQFELDVKYVLSIHLALTTAKSVA